ncbi:MAG: SpoIIE family protein phosphatase [Gemmatimonadota bacterium]|nr:SpoIIE family protein phosphatase [Gemmatimonadota bacterium]
MRRNLEVEIENAARELAERYEEINLLYTISEILGRTVSLDRAAETILREVSETVGARRGAIFICEPGSDLLDPIASVGLAGELSSIPIADPRNLAALAFRGRHPVVIAPGDNVVDDGFRKGAALAVPIMWTREAGRPELLGAVSLSDRGTEAAFSAGDVKLVAAIATQIGSAIQNARLVRESIEQQRLLQEVSLAHDLQMKLLPSGDVVAPQADAAARVVPAESVGGDFYHLFRLTPSATGVMIGDVSSHGYRAALIMALTMSAAAIHAQSTLDPGAMLHALLYSLRDELSSTEMFITMFYGVVDKQGGTLEYANAGHPHVFCCRPGAVPERLGAMDPPLGMADKAPSSRTVPWVAGEDLLVLFTDGITDALNGDGKTMGEQRVLDTIRQNATEPSRVIVERVFQKLGEFTGDIPPRDDLTLVVLRS